ncbi:MAG: bifunctional phosphopantothenoylcysteine decarboxylase/phosphopantothenate--cysteine ligase CoaBC [Bacteroidales bacterium]|nr:bifunctional phosphopantothenoylcysteine decarboxylase/phosphopantothenate--cysteine ligase CoaBC [Bacteroidales bacterium]
MSLKGRRILIGITGSIAAYKIPLLIRLLKKSGAEFKVIMTEASTDFVTPLTISTLSESPVFIDPFDKRTGVWNSHIELGNWADIFLIAPVSANTLAKMAMGIADNLLMTTYLATRCPVFFAPAMDLDMYKHPTTQRNIEIIRTFGHRLIEPREGELASGLCGAGRMEEPEEMAKIIADFFKPLKSFEGKKVLITAGPTFENIDPVRFIGNYSSGKMGFALAETMAQRGATVTLISGPIHLSTNSNEINRIDVTSAEQMLDACQQYSGQADIIIMAAAVADYQPVQMSDQKIKKSESNLSIDLKPTTDILSQLSKNRKPGQIIVGFALETENELANARKKLQNKNADIIVLNSLREPGSGFKTETNKVSILDRSGNVKEYDLKAKSQVAADIADFIYDFKA